MAPTRFVLVLTAVLPAGVHATEPAAADRTWKAVKAEVKAKTRRYVVPTVIATRTLTGRRYFGDPESPSPSGTFNYTETQELLASHRGLQIRSRIRVQVYDRGDYVKTDPPVAYRRARIGWGIPLLSRKVTEGDWGDALGAEATPAGPMQRLTLRVAGLLRGEPTDYMAGAGLMYKPETWNAKQRAKFLADHPRYDELGVDPTWGHDF